MPGRARKRSLTIAGHRTSISLEDGFWSALKEVANAEGRSVTELVSEIDAGRDGIGLSGAIRIHLLEHYRRRAQKPER